MKSSQWWHFLIDHNEYSPGVQSWLANASVCHMTSFIGKSRDDGFSARKPKRAVRCKY